MYRNSYLVIIWKEEDGKRNIDLLPSRMMVCPEITAEKHAFAYYEKDSFKYLEAEYSSSSMDNLVEVNYENDYNAKHKNLEGTMKLIFSSITKQSLDKVLWKKIGESQFIQSPANAFWIHVEDIEEVGAQKRVLEDEVIPWLDWK